MHDTDRKDLISSLFLAFSTGLGASIILMLIVVALSSASHAEPMGEKGAGSVSLKLADGKTVVEAPRLKTDVQIDIAGLIARVRVKQRFINESSQWAEGIYTFPLPDDSAVDHLRLMVDQRIIEGEIKPKLEAKRIYAEAKQAGKKASLLVQHRSNIFSTSVANIPPNEELLVEIEYQQSVKSLEGVFSLRFPMVIAPRYIPGDAIDNELLVQQSDLGKGSWAVPTDQVPDADQIAPPVITDEQSVRNWIDIRVDLAAGFDIDQLTSLYHSVQQHELSPQHVQLSLPEGGVLADRDFVLQWQAMANQQPVAALFREQRDDAEYGLLMLSPPNLVTDAQITQRELILVVDTSGSMFGESMEQAKEALKFAMNNLRPDDYFNIIHFNNETHQLYRQSVPANQRNIRDAIEYVNQLEADGGTEMLPAMQAALMPSSAIAYKQVVFLTDGAIGNEQALFAALQAALGDTRLFTVGIGSAPNSHFMTRAAEYGRGSFTYIGNINEVSTQMAALFRKLQSPLLTDIEVEWVGVNAELAPMRIPDLYAGEPLMLAARYQSGLSAIHVSGKIAGQTWQHSLKVGDGGVLHKGVHVLWARRMVRDLMGKKVLASDGESIKQSIVDLALRHHLVTRYTSLVAVDKTPVRSQEQSLSSTRLPVHRAKGLSMPQTSTDMTLYGLLSLLFLTLAYMSKGARRIA